MVNVRFEFIFGGFKTMTEWQKAVGVLNVSRNCFILMDLLDQKYTYSSVLKERHGSLIWNNSGRLYWAGCIGVKVPSETPLFKHYIVKN